MLEKSARGKVGHEKNAEKVGGKAEHLNLGEKRGSAGSGTSATEKEGGRLLGLGLRGKKEHVKCGGGSGKNLLLLKWEEK